MTKSSFFLAAAALAAGSFAAHAANSIAPLTGFGGSDGWLSPAEGGYSYLTTGNTERGLAYGNGQVYLVSRVGGNNVRRLDAATGADLGALNVSGITGGTFQVNMAGVAGDGAIYVCNLASPVTNTSAFKVYRWANDAATPTLAYSSTTITTGRMGDTLDVTGSGSSTRLVAGESNSGGSGARNGYAVMTTVDGAAYTGGLVTFAGTPPAAGDFRLGITFAGADKVLGTAGGGATTTVRYTSYAGTAGTLIGSLSLPVSGAQRPMDYAIVNGVPVLATVSTGDATVRVYDLTNPLNPVLLLSANNTTGTLAGNANGTGAVAWGSISGSSATLYAMSSNQGIQAFSLTIIPEPAAASLLALGLAALFATRRSRA